MQDYMVETITPSDLWSPLVIAIPCRD